MRIKKTDESGQQALVKFDAELAARAALSAQMEAGVSLGQFISTRNGHFSYQGAPIKDDRLEVVVMASILENKFYDRDFDPDQPSSPACYAFGTDNATMCPHAAAPTPQCETCFACKQNQFGTSIRGRGKACKNSRRIALLSKDDLKNITEGPIAYLPLPVTSVRGWAACVMQITQVLKYPLWAMVTEITIAPDLKTQYCISFRALSSITDRTMLTALLARSNQVEEGIGFPYPVYQQLSVPTGKRSKKKEQPQPQQKTKF